MAVKDNPHACRGTIGVPTKGRDKLRDDPNRGKKKKIGNKSPNDDLLSLQPQHIRGQLLDKCIVKTQKEIKENRKPVSSRIISRTHIPRERINKKERTAKNKNRKK